MCCGFTRTRSPSGSGTCIGDLVRYRLPFSPVGDIAYPIVRRQLQRIFCYREQVVRDALLGPQTKH